MDCISARLREDYGDVLVGSVDAFQGSEREAIIVSMVRQGNYGDVCVCLRVCVCVWMRACVCVFSGTVIAAKRGCLCVCHFKPGLATFWGRCATTMIATLDFWRMSDAQTSPWSGQRCIFFLWVLCGRWGRRREG